MIIFDGRRSRRGGLGRLAGLQTAAADGGAARKQAQRLPGGWPLPSAAMTTEDAADRQKSERRRWRAAAARPVSASCFGWLHPL